jgi:4-hydroxybenzoate polyprenyltransferase
MVAIGSWSTSSRTSRTSSTSDGSRRAVAVGLIRIVHPFPSALDGFVTAALILIAGGSAEVATRLGVAMFALQAAIGTANDLIDEPLDRGRKTGKPLPRGLVSRAAARALAIGALVIGLGLSAVSGLPVLLVAIAGCSIGLIYDRWLKGTIWSWLPFAIGIPLLPVYAWLGATGRLPAPFLVLIPAAVVAGAALALANLLADLERDQAAGAESAATRLGADRAWLLCSALFVVVALVAAGSLAALSGRGLGLAGVVSGGAIVAAGLVIGRGSRPALRERAWELEAAGVGLLAAGWVAAIAAAGAL